MEPIDNEIDNNDRTSYVLIHGSYFGGNPESPIGIIPSFVVRKMGIVTYNSLFEFDLNLKLIYKNNIWTGFSYRTHEKAMCAMIGFNTGRMFVGWSYDIGTSDLGAYHNGSHNIAIGFKIGGKKRRQMRKQTPLYFPFREAGFLNRQGNEKVIIGRLDDKKNSLEKNIKNFLNQKKPIKFEENDSRFLDSFDHVLNALVNQAEEDEKFGIPLNSGPIAFKNFDLKESIGNNWYSDDI